MALPQANQNPNIGNDNPYQHLGRERSSAPGWSWKLFSFSIIILIIVVVIFLGMQFGYKPFLNSQISNLDEQLEEFEGKISMEDQVAFVNFYSQVVYLEEILDGHVFFSPFFNLLEKNTHSGVFFSDIDYELSENKVSLEGRASSFEALGQQLERFDNLAEIKRTILSESQAVNGGISFRLLVFPDKDLFTVERVDKSSSVTASQNTAQPADSEQGGSEAANTDSSAEDTETSESNL